jgi:hypothetical protein
MSFYPLHYKSVFPNPNVNTVHHIWLAFARQILLRKNKIPEKKRAKAETAIGYKDSVHNSRPWLRASSFFPLKISEVQQSYL